MIKATLLASMRVHKRSDLGLRTSSNLRFCCANVLHRDAGEGCMPDRNGSPLIATTCRHHPCFTLRLMCHAASEPTGAATELLVALMSYAIRVGTALSAHPLLNDARYV